MVQGISYGCVLNLNETSIKLHWWRGEGDGGVIIGKIFVIDSYHVSGLLDQFDRSLFFGPKLIILVEWIDPPPHHGNSTKFINIFI